VVDSLGDAGVGVAAGQGDLRYCLARANALPGPDTITFSVRGTINLTGALPDLASDIVLLGPTPGGMTVRRNTGGNYRVFNVAAGAVVGMCWLNVLNGSYPPSGEGGGIRNQGSLTLVHTSVSGNKASYGGGISNGGSLVLENSSVANNTAGGGGGIYNTGTLVIQNSTVSGNHATASGGGLGRTAAASSTRDPSRSFPAASVPTKPTALALTIPGPSAGGSTAARY
jgi:predicted outer membrane repeat protein